MPVKREKLDPISQLTIWGGQLVALINRISDSSIDPNAVSYSEAKVLDETSVNNMLKDMVNNSLDVINCLSAASDPAVGPLRPGETDKETEYKRDFLVGMTVVSALSNFIGEKIITSEQIKLLNRAGFPEAGASVFANINVSKLGVPAAIRRNLAVIEEHLEDAERGGGSKAVDVNEDSLRVWLDTFKQGLITLSERPDLADMDGNISDYTFDPVVLLGNIAEAMNDQEGALSISSISTFSHDRGPTR